MPHTYTPTAARNATFTVPDDGDSANAASIQTPVQQLADELEYIQDKIPGGIVGAQVRFQVPLNFGPWNQDGRFGQDGVFITQASVASAGQVFFELAGMNLVPNLTIKEIRVRIQPMTGHGALPATKPQITLTIVNGNTGAVSTFGPQADTSANVSAYEIAHDIALTGLSVSMSSITMRYYIDFRGEAGANSLAGLVVYAATIDIVGV